MSECKFPYLGFGLGLRAEHYTSILETLPKLDWFEIITENYLMPGGLPLYYLEQIRSHYPITMHGVSLSIGGSDPLNFNYLQQVKDLASRIEAVWLSDHLCWTGVDGINLHDLLPLPYTEKVINYIVNRIEQVQEFLGRQILIENVSSYLTYKQSEMDEWEFLREIAERADCFILLDVNNIYVSAYNHEFYWRDYLYAIPAKRVKQIHLAGHSNQGDYIIDTHDAPVIADVWDLYRETIKHFGLISTLLERDDNIPVIEELLQEITQGRQIVEETHGKKILID